MYLRWNRMPELADLPPEERKRLWQAARRDPFRPTDFLWLVVILGIAIGAGIALVYVPTNLSGWIGLPIFLAVDLGLGVVINALLILRYRPIVRRLRGGS